MPTVLALLALLSPPALPASVFAEHPALAAGVEPFHRYISSESSLPARDRELLILRLAALSRSAHVWHEHVPVGLEAGLRREEIARVGSGPEAKGWSAFDAALVRAAGELHAQSFVSDATWNALAARYTRHQLMDVVFTVAHYSMWAMTVNTLGLPAATSPVPLPAAAPRLGIRDHQPLAAPRVPPLDPPDWTPAVRTGRPWESAARWPESRSTPWCSWGSVSWNSA